MLSPPPQKKIDHFLCFEKDAVHYCKKQMCICWGRHSSALEQGIDIRAGGFPGDRGADHLLEVLKLEQGGEVVALLDVTVAAVCCQSSGLVLHPFDSTPPGPRH